jgi:hypothetical protein
MTIPDTMNQSIPSPTIYGRKDSDVGPWYRQRWPWFLMLGPAIVVVAAFYTAYLAVKSNDGLVTDDYYQKGLAAGQTLHASALAARWGLKARLRLTSEAVTLELNADQPPAVWPDLVRITLSHPTRAGLDQEAVLERKGSTYSGELHLPRSGHWLVLIEDAQKTWRLLGNVLLPATGAIQIDSHQAIAPRER